MSNVSVTIQFEVQATLPDGSPYRNMGVQILRIWFGTIVEYYLIENTQLLISALNRIAPSGNAEALRHS
jgi:hypothetical protein